MELDKKITYGFENRFRHALAEFPKEFSDYNTMVNFYIDHNTHTNSFLTSKIITIPVIFHVVFDRLENNISLEAIKKIVSELNAFYSKYKINFKLALIGKKGNRLKEPGVVRHDWTHKLYIDREKKRKMFYRNWGVSDNETFLPIRNLKKELNWNPQEYFNIYLVNAIRGKDNFKYSDTVNSVTAEVSGELESFGIVIPFYALPKEDLRYTYSDQPDKDSIRSFKGVYGNVQDNIDFNEEANLYELEPVNTDKGAYISIIHSVALSFNLLSLFHTKFSKNYWIDSCADKSDHCGYNGNLYSGDCSNDTVHLKAEEYLKLLDDGIVKLSCSGDKIETYDGNNLMAHPYFIQKDIEENLEDLNVKKYKLTDNQIHRIRVNFFLFVDNYPSIWNSLSNSIKDDLIIHPSDPNQSGCTDPFAVNYNPFALTDDNSCIYDTNDEQEDDQDIIEDGEIVVDPCESFFLDANSSIPQFSQVLTEVQNKFFAKYNAQPISDSLLESVNRFKLIEKAIKKIVNSIL